MWPQTIQFINCCEKKLGTKQTFYDIGIIWNNSGLRSDLKLQGTIFLTVRKTCFTCPFFFSYRDSVIPIQ